MPIQGSGYNGSVVFSVPSPNTEGMFGIAIVELPEKYDYLMTQLSSSHL
jgi:hypothetical protein